VPAHRFEIGRLDGRRAARHLDREVEHRALARREIGVAVVCGHLIGDLGLLAQDTERRSVSYRSVGARSGTRKRLMGFVAAFSSAERFERGVDLHGCLVRRQHQCPPRPERRQL
jgi:hypothetical protein